MDTASAQRILVITKFRYMGDTIVATPFLSQLREACPNAHIVLLTGSFGPTLLGHCPFVDDVWTYDSTTESARALTKRIAAADFEAAYLLNRSYSAARVAAKARIPKRIGFNTEFRGWMLTDRVPYDESKKEIESCLDLLRVTGLPAHFALPKLCVSADERLEVQALLESHGVSGDSFVVGMQPGANDAPIREWGVDKFAALADRLTDESGARVLLLGSKTESETSRRVRDNAKSRPIDLTGETKIRQAFAIQSRCNLWIGNDGGLLHSAAALTPASVGIFGPTKATRWGYETANHRTVVSPVKVRRHDNEGIRRALDSISLDLVYETALSAVEFASRP